MNNRITSHALVASAFALSVFCVGEQARAEGSVADKAAAESLFTSAKQLMAEGQFAQACPKLADSQRLDPGVGTLLNLGLCYKSLGRTASAWATFKDAAAAARDAGQTDRETIARDEAAALELKLSHLTVAVAPETAALQPQVSLDGAPLPASAWGVQTPVDPGTHVVDVTAKTKRPWRGEIAVGADNDAKRVFVPALVDAPVAPPTKGGADSSSAARPPNQTLRIVGYSAAGVGLAAIGVGAFFGVQALNDKKASDDQCDGGRCTQGGLDHYNSAQTNGVIADVCFGAGLVAIGVGAFLVVTNGGVPFVKKKETVARHEPRLQLGGGVGPSGGSVSVRTAF